MFPISLFVKQNGNIVYDCLVETIASSEERMKAVSDMGVDSIAEWKNLHSTIWEPNMKLMRFFLSTANGQDYKFENSDEIVQSKLDYPCVNPNVLLKPHKYVYCCSSDSSNSIGIVKIDTVSKTKDNWFPEQNEILDEPSFICKTETNGEEDDGYIISILHNFVEQTSKLVLFDAKSIGRGPKIEKTLKVFLPKGEHGTFTNGLVHKEEDIVRKFRAMKALDKGWNDMGAGFSGLGITQGM